MPFKSKAQQRFMFSQHPEMAKEWADKTPDISKLPEHMKGACMGTGLCAGGCMYEGGNVEAPGGQNEKDKELMEHMEASMHGGGCIEQSGEGYYSGGAAAEAAGMNDNKGWGFADGGELPSTVDQSTSTLGKLPARNMTPEDEHENMMQMLEMQADAMGKNYRDEMGDTGNLKGLQDVANKKAEGKAGGGEVMATAAPDPYVAPEEDKKKIAGYDGGGVTGTSPMEEIEDPKDKVLDDATGIHPSNEITAGQQAAQMEKDENNNFFQAMQNAPQSTPSAADQAAALLSAPRPVAPTAAAPTLTPAAPVASPTAPIAAPTATPVAMPAASAAAPMGPNKPTADELMDFFSQAGKNVNKYTPDAEAAAQRALLQRETGAGGQIKNFADTAADAIMQGVSRAGPFGAREQANNQRNFLQEGAVNKIGALGKQQGELEQLKLGLMKENPAGPMSEGMRTLAAKVLGLPSLPQNISGADIAKLIPGLGELAYHQNMIGVTSAKNQQEHEAQLLARLSQIDESLQNGSMMGRLLDQAERKGLQDEANAIRNELGVGGKGSPATKTGPHGPGVTQNGHHFTWNGTEYIQDK
jgi:hypothetical protein